MIEPKAITVAMIRDPQGATWQAQIQVEYKNRQGTDVLPLYDGNTTDPIRLLKRCMDALDKKFKQVNGKIVKL